MTLAQEYLQKKTSHWERLKAAPRTPENEYRLWVFERLFVRSGRLIIPEYEVISRTRNGTPIVKRAT